VAIESIFEALETIFGARRIFFLGSPERQKWPLGVDLSPLAVGVDCRSHPLAVGVDHGHPQWPDFFFLLVGSLERQVWPLRVAGSLPLAVGVDRGHPQWPDLSFFFFCLPEKLPEVSGEWRCPSPEVGGGLFIWWLDWLIECFDFIFSLCNFLKWVRCQLMNSRQKGGVFCNDRTAAALQAKLHAQSQDHLYYAIYGISGPMFMICTH
jgi:hypothetical protein